MSVSVGPAFAGYDASQMVIVTSCETTITSIVHDVNDNHAKLGRDIASGVAAVMGPAFLAGRVTPKDMTDRITKTVTTIDATLDEYDTQSTYARNDLHTALGAYISAQIKSALKTVESTIKSVVQEKTSAQP